MIIFCFVFFTAKACIHLVHFYLWGRRQGPWKWPCRSWQGWRGRSQQYRWEWQRKNTLTTRGIWTVWQRIGTKLQFDIIAIIISLSMFDPSSWSTQDRNNNKVQDKHAWFPAFSGGKSLKPLFSGQKWETVIVNGELRSVTIRPSDGERRQI